MGYVFQTRIGKGGGVVIFNSNFFWGGGSVLKHYTFLKTTAPPWDVINDRSLNPLLLISGGRFESQSHYYVRGLPIRLEFNQGQTATTK